MLELSEHFTLHPGLRKGPCPHAHLPKSSCQPIFRLNMKGTSATPEHPLRAGTHLAVTPASHRYFSITFFQGQAGILFQQSFLFFGGFIIDVSMVPIFSSGLKSKQHCSVQIEGIF